MLFFVKISCFNNIFNSKFCIKFWNILEGIYDIVFLVLDLFCYQYDLLGNCLLKMLISVVFSSLNFSGAVKLYFYLWYTLLYLLLYLKLSGCHVSMNCTDVLKSTHLIILVDYFLRTTVKKRMALQHL